MPPSQDQTPPTAGDSPHLGERNVDQRPMMLIYGASITLCLIGFLIGCVGIQYLRHAQSFEAGDLMWKAGVVLMLLAASAFHAIPGALGAMRHPWATGRGSELAPHHPRVGGLVQAWIGFIVASVALLLGLDAFISIPFFETRFGLLVTFGVLFLCAFIPLMAVYMFDRRR